MGLPARCTPSSPTTSPQGPPWSPTDGPVTWASTRSATPMIGAVTAPPRPWARTSASCCRECTASRPWPNGGCFPPTKARCTSSTCLVTWTSSASGSTIAAHAAAVWSSTGCSNWPSGTTQSVTSSSLRAPSRRRSGRPLPETEATRLAWTAPAPDDPGAIRPDEAKSAQMDSPDGAFAVLHGHNPYSMTFPNIYPPQLANLLYGHGVVINGRITYGFPHLPVALLVAIPGQ